MPGDYDPTLGLEDNDCAAGGPPAGGEPVYRGVTTCSGTQAEINACLQAIVDGAGPGERFGGWSPFFSQCGCTICPLTCADAFPLALAGMTFFETCGGTPGTWFYFIGGRQLNDRYPGDGKCQLMAVVNFTAFYLVPVPGVRQDPLCAGFSGLESEFASYQIQIRARLTGQGTPQQKLVYDYEYYFTGFGYGTEYHQAEAISGVCVGGSGGCAHNVNCQTRTAAPVSPDYHVRDKNLGNPNKVLLKSGVLRDDQVDHGECRFVIPLGGDVKDGYWDVCGAKDDQGNLKNFDLTLTCKFVMGNSGKFSFYSGTGPVFELDQSRGYSETWWVGEPDKSGKSEITGGEGGVPQNPPPKNWWGGPHPSESVARYWRSMIGGPNYCAVFQDVEGDPASSVVTVLPAGAPDPDHTLGEPYYECVSRAALVSLGVPADKVAVGLRATGLPPRFPEPWPFTSKTRAQAGEPNLPRFVKITDGPWFNQVQEKWNLRDNCPQEKLPPVPADPTVEDLAGTLCAGGQTRFTFDELPAGVSPFLPWYGYDKRRSGLEMCRQNCPRCHRLRTCVIVNQFGESIVVQEPEDAGSDWRPDLPARYDLRSAMTWHKTFCEWVCANPCNKSAFPEQCDPAHPNYVGCKDVFPRPPIPAPGGGGGGGGGPAPAPLGFPARFSGPAPDLSAAGPGAAVAAGGPALKCGHLGERVEFKDTCRTGWMCKHRCKKYDAGDPEVTEFLGPEGLTVPGSDDHCLDCPGRADLVPFLEVRRPAPAAATELPMLTADKIPCRHRGGKTGDLKQCHTCSGTVLQAVFACSLYGECVVTGGGQGVRGCDACGSRADPAAEPETVRPEHRGEAERLAREREEFRAALPPYPAGRFSGRGVVILAEGAGYYPGAYVAAKMLRRHGYAGPVTVYADAAPEKLRALAGVEVRDTARLKGEGYDGSRAAAWSLKLAAVEDSPFEDVLFLDADCYPVRPVDALWGAAPSGWLAWYDVPHGRRNLVWAAHALEGDALGGGLQGGQFVVRKGAAWAELQVARWVDRHYRFYHGNGYQFGDQDSPRVAFRAAGRRPDLVAREPAGAAGCLLMPDPAAPGDALFVHRVRNKLAPPGAFSPAPHFSWDLPGEADAWSYFLDFLRGG